MSDQDFVIDLEADDTEGHGSGQAFVEPDGTDWLEDRLRRDPGSTRIRVMPLDEADVEDADTEGHAASAQVRVRAALEDDDTEGHAISIRFPSRGEADAFRRRLLLTGVLAGTVALGAAGGIGLANLSSNEAGSAGAAQSATTGSDWTQAERRAAAGPATSGNDWTQVERPGGASATSADADEAAQSTIGTRGLRPE